ncbi:hypothetical protein Q1695_002263 [Nippostrongylus brasiliensis]|nr:hypothetical protein Q1695_002263 [Nippostrongylus brasiliensis]
MKLSQLVAKELHLLHHIESPATCSLNGVTTFELKNGHIHYRVFLVKNNEEQGMPSHEIAKLAAFFNSKFFHETVTTNRLAVPSGHFERSFRVVDDDVCYLVFVVAEKLATVHAINTSTMDREFIRVISENHENIRRYQSSLEPELIGILKDAVKGELAEYFSRPNEIIAKLEAVLRHTEVCPEPSDRVICHGRLSAENCIFKENANYTSTPIENQVVDISEWENVHFGDVAFDLSHLIISSAEPSVRRSKYMAIFRRYYYARVDHRTTDFPLSVLKRLFRKHHKHAVLLGIEPLLEVLTSSESEEVKQAHSYRWESALDDAYHFTTTEYVDDDEYSIFAK